MLAEFADGIVALVYKTYYVTKQCLRHGAHMEN